MYIVNGKESVVHCVDMVYTSTTVEPCDGEKEYIVVKHRQTKTNLVGHIWMTNRGKHFCRTLLGDVVVKWAGWTCWKTSVRNSLNIFSETLLARHLWTFLWDIIINTLVALSSWTLLGKHFCGTNFWRAVGQSWRTFFGYISPKRSTSCGSAQHADLRFEGWPSSVCYLFKGVWGLRSVRRSNT